MNRFQPIYDIAELCVQRGVHKVILCPGSRCAPLTLAFTRHPGIEKKIFPDERSAGFIGLGIAQKTKVPAILVCTSGSAAYNFAPAVAEAYFSNTPLLIFTADRPPEWIGQQDGQAIYQHDLFGKHVKGNFTLPDSYDHPDNVWMINRIINEAINLASQDPQGPVHINAPFREPLYPSPDEPFQYTTNLRRLEPLQREFVIKNEQKQFIEQGLKRFYNVLIVSGQQVYDPEMIQAIETCVDQHPIPMVADILSNLHPVERVIRHADLFLGQASQAVKKTITPDLLITLGDSVLSKNLKTFLRKHPPMEHWHIQKGPIVPDTFQHVTHILETTPKEFFQFLASVSSPETFENQKQRNFYKLWEIEERRFFRSIENFFPQPELAELELVHEVIQNLPEGTHLHLANSMSVRYANFIGLSARQKNIQVFANRGTSGIDGCTSTVVGHALASEAPQVLITGDLAFFYDRNAFWHNYPLPNLRVVLLNNHGGIIFGMIDGPAKLPEADEYFITRQALNARRLCEEFNYSYLHLDNRRKMKNLLKDFFDSDGQTKILELESDPTLNKTIFENLKQQLKKSYEL
jgi:2-succinyl-5-enolpyruvyl-6-hydroxy-3-cyclohexene-1-carboxylate synthase